MATTAEAKEKEILNNMKLLQISREEAEQLWEDDHSDEILPEVAEMEEKAKQLKRHYETGEKKERKKSTRERKVDEDKKIILAEVAEVVAKLGTIQNIKTETEISFLYKDSEYTIKLTKHRRKKSD